MISKSSHHRMISMAAAVLFLVVASNAGATLVTWNVGDHPNGALADPTYMLRLGTNASKPNTFTVETDGTGATFSFNSDAATDTATMQGTIQHNRDPSGPISGGFYTISATFQTVEFTSGVTSWHSPNPANAVYDEMLQDLLDNSDETPYNDPEHISNADRIYFELIDMTLTHVSGPNPFPDPWQWDEYPNDTDKLFFIQKNHRTNDDVLAAAGWLELYEDGGREATSDFLFTLHIPDTPEDMPEPSVLVLLGAGLAALGVFGRRER